MREIAERLVNGPMWIRSFQHVPLVIRAMISAGHIKRTKPARGLGRNMIGLTVAGAEHYGLAVDVSNLIEPLLEQRRPKRNRPSGAERERQKDVVAEHVANGGSIATSAPLVGMSKAYCQILWGEICQGLGWQAS